jgi:cytochrome c556
MKGLVMRVGLVVLGPLALLVVTRGAEPERTPSIRAVMHKQYRVTRAPFLAIKKELGADTPDWETIGVAAREFTALAAVLPKNEPKWGEKESWTRFTTLHMDDAKELERAAGARDREALQAVHRRLETACKGCHDAHRSQRRE